jgi:hypothetical protein
MDSLQDMLKNKRPSEPPQVVALKEYARKNYGIEIQVRTSRTHYLLTVPGAAYAHKFRVDTTAITEACQLDKRLVIHIGY